LERRTLLAMVVAQGTEGWALTWDYWNPPGFSVEGTGPNFGIGDFVNGNSYPLWGSGSGPQEAGQYHFSVSSVPANAGDPIWAEELEYTHPLNAPQVSPPEVMDDAAYLAWSYTQHSARTGDELWQQVDGGGWELLDGSFDGIALIENLEPDRSYGYMARSLSSDHQADRNSAITW
jgi:hypothetical protein